ncbi:conserved hypothetical protein [Hyella patelloides LEGE 07179]|uniref:Phytanoyl-CoA dioxygenase n=1 Tax=Hyella patelloides LEGE 07179 TaxID=945734 RepID=A0A563VYR6_9CYAN|nr:phytanoyl-CoA dioxygenase family protein [Hyella patelloides]VEP16403.1 conserved hypothetical protein [Hyella patelloides LEGE 07179]
MNQVNDFWINGYEIIPQLINSNLVNDLKKAIISNIEAKSAYGVRDLHHKIPKISDLTNSQLIVNTLKQYTKYNQFQLIKAIFFNKNIDHNWAVAWHQDKTIAVKQKLNLTEYKNWTVKQGTLHVQPPLKILEKITAIRIALDDTDSNNGALKIIPNSHKLGILTQPEINQITNERKPILCSLKAGDAIIMHPLILHSSSKSINGNERRTIHLEYCSCNLPQGLDWHN